MTDLAIRICKCADKHPWLRFIAWPFARYLDAKYQ